MLGWKTLDGEGVCVRALVHYADEKTAYLDFLRYSTTCARLVLRQQRPALLSSPLWRGASENKPSRLECFHSPFAWPLRWRRRELSMHQPTSAPLSARTHFLQTRKPRDLCLLFALIFSLCLVFSPEELSKAVEAPLRPY